jgi:hypothetical protein
MKTLMAALLLLPTLAFADPAKEKDIRRLMQLTNQAQLGAQVVKQVLETFKNTMPNVPANFWSEFSNEVKADELVEKIIPVYDKNLSSQEIKDIIKFYESPTGKRLISVMPVITQESMVIGQQWGREIGERVVKKLQQKK